MMLDDISVDRRKLNSGSWMDLGASKFLIAHCSKPEFKIDLAIKMGDKGFVSLYDLCEVLSEHILLDWKFVKQPNGEYLEYTPALAIHALITNAELRDFVEERSQDYKYFQRVDCEPN